MNRSPSLSRFRPTPRRLASLLTARAATGGSGNLRPAWRLAPRGFLPSQAHNGNDAVTPGRSAAQSHLPRAVPGETSAVPSPGFYATSSAPRRRLRVLLAEDDPMVARSTIAVLQRLGHTVAHALDGSEAWNSLQERMHEFDALLLDLVMPRMTGADLAHRARAGGFTGPIVLVSGLVMTFDPDALALLGIRSFLTKPFLPSELDRALQAG